MVAAAARPAQRTCLVTGGTSGLGREVAGKLALAGWRVLVACRDPDAGRAVAGELTRRAANAARCCEAPRAEEDLLPGSVSAVALDLTDLRSVRDCAARVREMLRGGDRGGGGGGERRVEEGLQLLICNAAVAQPRFGETKDGLEETLAVNHYGHFLLVNLLLPVLETSAVGARVVYVSSSLHRKVDAESVCRGIRRLTTRMPDREGRAGFRGFPDQYSLSKRFNSLVAHDLASRVLPQGGVTAASVSPGFMPATGLGRNFNLLVRLAMTYAAPILARRRVRSPEQGADAVLRVAVAEGGDFVNGGYNEDGAWIEDWGADPEAEKELWSASCEVVGIPDVSR